MHAVRSSRLFFAALCLALGTLLPSTGLAAAGATQAGSADDASKPPSPEQLEQLVAPIALYPDALLAQILMASTYPLEVVEAARWLKANPGLDAKALEAAMEKQSWDPSVKSLTAFPQPLQMMNDKLTWTTQLGDAFLADQQGVMTAAQVLRQKAKAEGNLESNEQQTVTVEQQPTGSQKETIIIAPSNPQVVYVPTYNPTIVYGTWAYPMYPPYYWYPPGYVATASVVSFGVGLTVGAAMWGGCNWHHSNVDINVNRYNNFNRTNISNNNWNHDSRHRRGVSYGNRDLQKRYGSNQARNAQAREAFRGRADQGRQQIAAGQADRFKGSHPSDMRQGAANRLGNADGNLGASARDRASGNRSPGSGDRDRASVSRERERARNAGGSGDRRDSAFGGIGNGHEARRNANRGFESRGGSSRWGSGGGRMNRGGGGFGRGGGGFGRGGGRGGGLGGMRGGGRRR